MLHDCLDERDVLRIFNQGELWKFNFLIGGFSFMVCYDSFVSYDNNCDHNYFNNIIATSYFFVS